MVEQTSSLPLPRYFVMDLVASSRHYMLLYGDELFFPLKRKALCIKKKVLSEFEGGGGGGTSPNQPLDLTTILTNRESWELEELA